MNRLCTFTAAILLCTGVARAEGLHGADLPLPDRRLDFNVRRLPASKLFGAITEISHVQIVADPCLDKTFIDIKLKNAPLPLVFDAVASQAGLEYRLEGSAIRVTCVDGAGFLPSPDTSPGDAPRPRLDLREALRHAFPKATDDDLNRAMAMLYSQLGHD